jgi:hypothetical protein
MDKIREQLSQCPIRTRLSLTGTLVVARDIAHAKLQVRGWQRSLHIRSNCLTHTSTGERLTACLCREIHSSRKITEKNSGIDALMQ